MLFSTEDAGLSGRPITVRSMSKTFIVVLLLLSAGHKGGDVVIDTAREWRESRRCELLRGYRDFDYCFDDAKPPAIEYGKYPSSGCTIKREKQNGTFQFVGRCRLEVPSQYIVNYESRHADEEKVDLRCSCSKIQLTEVSPPRTLNAQKR
jgi:hypothetical protein